MLQKYLYTRTDNIYIFFLVVMMVKTILMEFCQNTTIHGLGSIVDSKSSIIKRIAWFVIFVVSISYAGIQLKDNVDSKLTLEEFFCISLGSICYKIFFTTSKWLLFLIIDCHTQKQLLLLNPNSDLFMENLQSKFCLLV